MSSASSKVVSHQGMCMPCQLCLQSNTKMRHMYQMKGHPQLNVVYVWLTSEKPTIKEDNCLCLPCVKQIQRNYNKPKYIPRWLPKAECEKKCSIESCKALVETTTSQMTVKAFAKTQNNQLRKHVGMRHTWWLRICWKNIMTRYTWMTVMMIWTTSEVRRRTRMKNLEH